jgi:heat shock protein HslJ
MRLGSAIFVCLATVALTACQADETVRAYGGADKTWRLVSIDDTAFAASATLTFPEPGRIAGQAPCNAYSAEMSVPYPWFETGPIAATRATCPDQQAETLFFQTLGEMTLSEVLGDTLILSTPEGRLMLFKADD